MARDRGIRQARTVSSAKGDMGYLHLSLPPLKRGTGHLAIWLARRLCLGCPLRTNTT